MKVPEEIDWDVMRIMSHERFHVSNPNEILFGWTLKQLADAHTVCDMIEDLDAKVAQANKTS